VYPSDNTQFTIRGIGQSSPLCCAKPGSKIYYNSLALRHKNTKALDILQINIIYIYYLLYYASLYHPINAVGDNKSFRR